jgi:Zn-dependent protease with chaperone function
VNFFEHQDRARSSTRKLVLLFVLAVASLIVITTFLVVFILGLAEQGGTQVAPGLNTRFLGSDVFLLVSVVVITVVMLGTLYRMTQLRGGGSIVAENLGGRLLNVHTRDADERKILNVVEEMAIAAGLPVPQVYLLEDEAINAFAAGYRQQDAVIGVTRGCIAQLNRDELQGVIAHEFSHILNGDMRLNIRLIGWLYGIMVLGLIGHHLLRGSRYAHGRGSRNNKGGVLLLGLGLMIVGYSGTFFGNLIKAAVSRQREFLADASAVQYTRNPGGIGGALKKIGANATGSMIASADTSEISHMLFGQGVRAGLTGLFATHPPLEERIRRLDPRWDGAFAQTAAAAATASIAGNSGAIGFVGSVGQPDAASLAEARKRIEGIPAALQDEVHTTLGSSLLMHALIVSASEQSALGAQLGFLRQKLNAESYRLFTKLHRAVAVLDRNLFLALVDLALPSLRQLSPAQYRGFMGELHQLMQADARISLFEWCLFRILHSSLDRHPGRREAQHDLGTCATQCHLLLSALARAGHAGDDAAAAAALSAGAQYLQLPPAQQELRTEAVTLAELDSAMDRLRNLKPLQKPKLLKALVQCIQKDGVVTSAEGELLRAVGATLDCPIPPLRTEEL